jgi:hypothetical protein
MPLKGQFTGVSTADLNSLCLLPFLMSLESTVGIAKVGTKSLRATVPEGIVAFLGIREGDKLEWKMEIINDVRVAVVTKRRGR